MMTTVQTLEYFIFIGSEQHLTILDQIFLISVMEILDTEAYLPELSSYLPMCRQLMVLSQTEYELPGVVPLEIGLEFIGQVPIT